MRFVKLPSGLLIDCSRVTHVDRQGGIEPNDWYAWLTGGERIALNDEDKAALEGELLKATPACICPLLDSEDENGGY